MIASAWLEETTNTFLQNGHRSWLDRAPNYGGTASELADALEAIEDTKYLAEPFRVAMCQRNYVVHGVILEIPGSKPFWAMKHQMTRKKNRDTPPERDIWKFTIEDLESLIDQLWDIQDELKMKSDELRRSQNAGEQPSDQALTSD